MAHILVTGSAGFIGSNLTRILLDEGHTVVAVDNFVTGSRENIEKLKPEPRLSFKELDIGDPAFADLSPTIRFDEIYHLACPTGVPNLVTRAEEMLHTCSFGTYNILNRARRDGAKVLFTSTAEMYGQPERFPQDETYNGNVDPLGKRSPYEEGKRFSESILAMYVRKHGVNARVVRVFNTYGPGMSLQDERVIPHFLKCIVEEKPLRIYGDGSQTRSHLFVTDLLAGLRVAMEKGTAGEAYNCGGGNPIPIRELAELLMRLSGYGKGIEYREHFIEDHRGRLPGVAKIEALGWKQTISLEEGLRKMLAHYIPMHSAIPVEIPAPLPA
jgi:nucleoside-diphosphate-sugar epimerase